MMQRRLLRALALAASLLATVSAQAAQVQLNAGDSGLTIRNAINSNFADVYSQAGASTAALGKLGTRATSGLVVAYGGDSTTTTGTVYSPPTAGIPQNFTGYYAVSYAGWLSAIAGGRVAIDPRMSVAGNSGGSVQRVIVTTAGACGANATLTATPSAPGGTPVAQAGAVTLTADASGNIPVGSIWAEPTPGSGYNSIPTWTISGCTGTAPGLVAVFGSEIGFGAPGDTSLGYLTRLRYDTGTASATPLADPKQSLFCLNPPDVIINSVGNNDVAGAIPLSTIQQNLQAIIAYEQSCGSRVINQGLVSRIGWTTALDRQRLQFNQWLIGLANLSRSGSGGFSPVGYVDLDKFSVDPSSSTGSAFANAKTDGVHPSVYEAFTEALLVLNVLAPSLPPVVTTNASQNDVYDATNNPTGDLLGLTLGHMQTTGGSLNGTSGNAAVAQYWTLATSNTTNAPVTPSIETARTDGRPGKRQVVSVTTTVGGSNQEQVLFEQSAGTVNTANLAAGDRIRPEITVDVSNVTGAVKSIGCYLLEKNSSGTILQQHQMLNQFISTNVMPTSAQVAAWEESRWLTDFGKSGSGSYKLTFRGLPITVSAAALSPSAGFYQIGCQLRVDTTSVVSTVTLKIGDAALRKVPAGQAY